MHYSFLLDRSKRNNMYKVSVIVPVYKAELYIEKCVNSLMSQTLQDIEYIFVDDCTPDNSINLLKEIIKNYPEKSNSVQIIKHDCNKGQAAARNTGIRAASGEFLAFVDADDWVNPLIYEVLYTNAQKEHAFISCCGIERMLNDSHYSFFNESTGDYFVYSTKEAISSILDNKIITCSPCDKIFHKSVVKNTPMLEGIIFEDFEVMPRWIHKAERIVYIGLPLYYYRTTPQSTMTTVSAKRLNEVKASELRIQFFKLNYPDLLDKVLARHIEICLNVLSCTVKAGNCHRERANLRRKILRAVSFKQFLHIKTYAKLKYVLLLCNLSIFDKVALLK